MILSPKPNRSRKAMAMMWDDWEEDYHQNQTQEQEEQEQKSYLDSDFLSILSNHKDYYKILEVNYDASEDDIRSNYIRLALDAAFSQKWHPDKQKEQDSATSRFQEINEAYQVLMDPMRRKEYDKRRMLHKYDYSAVEYLNCYKSLILTCNGLGIRQFIW